MSSSAPARRLAPRPSLAWIREPEGVAASSQERAPVLVAAQTEVRALRARPSFAPSGCACTCASRRWWLRTELLALAWRFANNLLKGNL